MGQAPHHYLIFETAGGFCGIAWNNVGITRFHNEQSGQTQEVQPPRCEPQRNPQGLSPIGPEAGRRFATDLYGL